MIQVAGTAATEALRVKNSVQGALSNTTVMTRIHTDSTAGKSIATRISSKKANHIELEHPFVQQLVQSGILSIHKVGTLDNFAAIFTKHIGADTFCRHL